MSDNTVDHDWLQRNFGLVGKVALVTGGTRGIGYMIAEGMLRAGAEVIICSRHAEDNEAAVARLSPLGPIRAVVADLGSEEGCRELAAYVAEHCSTLDVLVNNAGAAWGGSIEEYPEKGWDKVMALNVKAPFMLTRHLLPLLEAGSTADDRARVINVGSVDGLVVPATENFAYSVSKAAVHHLTRVLARHLTGRNVLVNAVAPGPFESKMMEWLLDNYADEITASVPVGRTGRPSEIASAVVFLAGAGGGFVAGAVLPVDGGLSTTLGYQWFDDEGD